MSLNAEELKRYDAYPLLVARLRSSYEVLSKNMFVSDGEDEDNNYEVQAEMNAIEELLKALGEKLW